MKRTTVKLTQEDQARLIRRIQMIESEFTELEDPLLEQAEADVSSRVRHIIQKHAPQKTPRTSNWPLYSIILGAAAALLITIHSPKTTRDSQISAEHGVPKNSVGLSLEACELRFRSPHDSLQYKGFKQQMEVYEFREDMDAYFVGKCKEAKGFSITVESPDQPGTVESVTFNQGNRWDYARNQKNEIFKLRLKKGRNYTVSAKDLRDSTQGSSRTYQILGNLK